MIRVEQWTVGWLFNSICVIGTTVGESSREIIWCIIRRIVGWSATGVLKLV
jgi:hypothetical protein